MPNDKLSSLVLPVKDPSTGIISNQTFDLAATADISGKADKVSGATNDNFAALDANGNLKDSGKNYSSFSSSDHSHLLYMGSASNPIGYISLESDSYYYISTTSSGSRRKYFKTPPDTWRGIQNNLTSTSTTDSLAAAQGKILNEKIESPIDDTTWATLTELFS